MKSTSKTGASELSRRNFLKTGVGTMAAGSIAGVAIQAGARTPSDTENASNRNAFETETGGQIYHLPRDHAMHGGDWYHCAEYQETNYFTGFFTDRDTGKPYSVFFCWACYGWDKKLGRPVWNALFSVTDIEDKKFYQCVQPMSGALTTRGSGPDVDDDQFFAEYEFDVDGAGSSGLFSYSAKDEAWRWSANVTTPTDQLPNQTPFSLDLKGRVMKPGYQCPVPYGMTQEGLGTEVSDNLANPFTAAGLSWYIIAPCQQSEMTLKVADLDLNLVGQIYHEHQWGRIRIPGMEQCRYFWGWARLNNGDIINWRTYRDVKTGKFVPGDSANRFNIVRTDGSVQYFMGPAFTYEPEKSWTSPETGVEYPIYGKMSTPLGIIYTDPIVEVAEAQLFNGGMWEGPARLRSNSPDGPVIGHAFLEFMYTPFDSPLGKDLPYNPDFTARRDANLPAAENFKQYVKW